VKIFVGFFGYGIGMARGIPRPSFLEVPDFFSSLIPRGIDSITPRILEVLANIPRGPRKFYPIDCNFGNEIFT
jgi:hypothetical protein